MATQNFSITDNAVNTHGRNLQGSVDEMNQNLASFKQALANLPAAWQGQSAQAFASIQSRFEAASKDLNSSLENIRTRVGNADAIYQSSHAQQAAELNSMNQSANWDGARFRN